MDNDIIKLSRTFRRYRFYYKIFDFITLFLFFYVLGYYFNAISIFSGYMEYYVISTVSLDKLLLIVLSAFISLLLVIIIHLRKVVVDPLTMIESRYKWMNERLRTAWDNRYEDNVIASDLSEQVTSALKKVNANSFLDRRYILTRLLLSTILAASLIGISTTQIHSNFTPGDITRIIEEARGNLPVNSLSEQISQENKMNDEDIYGETSVASLSGESVELHIIPGLGTEVTIRHAEQEDNVSFVSSNTFPGYRILSAPADESYQAILQLSDQDKDIVKDYAIQRSKL